MVGSYRPDVDGLRALAVLAVLVYHAFPAALPGGFMGVDVFFVISGFLISGIILEQLDHRTFTITGFYSRRIRRIFPALALVLLATVTFGWLALTPYDFHALGLHVTSGAAFASNLLLWREAGDYFADSTALKPLLHLWSLGIEEQYYLIWPLLLILLRDRVSAFLWLAGAIALASFAVNLVLVDQRPLAAFYLPQSRFWELMVGSGLAYMRRYHSKLEIPRGNLTAICAAGLLIGGFILLDEQRPFPGWWALLPTLCTAVLIWAGPNAVFNRRLLAHPVAVGIGLISYPLYLWHWPLLTFARILNDGEVSALTRAALLAVSFALAFLTYRLLEIPIRQRQIITPRRAVVALLAALGVVGFWGGLAYANVFPARSASVPKLLEISAAIHEWEAHPNGTFPGDTPRTVLFWGDSLMQHLLPRIAEIVRHPHGPRRTVVLQTQSGCVPILGIERFTISCENFTVNAFEKAQSLPNVDTVVIAASWAGFVEENNYYRLGDREHTRLDLKSPDNDWIWDQFESEVRTLTARERRVVLILTSPNNPAFAPGDMALRDGLGFRIQLPSPIPRDVIATRSARVDAKLKEIAARTGATWLDPKDWLCSLETCSPIDERGRLIYKDTMHVRPEIARERFMALDALVYLPRTSVSAAPATTLE